MFTKCFEFRETLIAVMWISLGLRLRTPLASRFRDLEFRYRAHVNLYLLRTVRAVCLEVRRVIMRFPDTMNVYAGGAVRARIHDVTFSTETASTILVNSWTSIHR